MRLKLCMAWVIAGMPHNLAKHKHWWGVQAIYSLQAAPVLVFYHRCVQILLQSDAARCPQ